MSRRQDFADMRCFNMGTAHYFFSAKSVLELKAKTAPAPRATPGLKFIDILPAKFTIV